MNKPLLSITVSVFQTSMGPMKAGVCDDGVCFLHFLDSKNSRYTTVFQKKFSSIPFITNNHILIDELYTQLQLYFNGELRAFAIPCVLVGTPFQIKAWNVVQGVAYGSTISYKMQAHSMGCPRAIRAAAHANSMNSIAIIVPCHRVITSTGIYGGYSGGIERKKYLLELEAQTLRRL